MTNPFKALEAKVLLTIGRHAIAAALSIVVAKAAALGLTLTADQVNGLMIAAYAALEKLLKPITQAMGEGQT